MTEITPAPAVPFHFKAFIRRPWVWPLLVALVLAAGFMLTQEQSGPARAARGLLAKDKEVGADFSGGMSFSAIAESRGVPAEPAPAPLSTAAATPAPGIARKVISTASLELKVKSASGAADTLSGMAVAAGGFVQSSSAAAADGNERTAAITLRVPAEKFQSFLDNAGSLGRIVRKEVSGQDVTEEYVDLQARLRNWENQERQLNLIMSRAKTVGEVLAVQDKLGGVRETIEQIAGKIKYYDYHVALATVSVTLYEGSKPAATPWIVEELSVLGRTLYGSFRSLLQVLLALIPWGLAGWGLWALGRRTIFRPKA